MAFLQGAVCITASVLPSATTVEVKIKGQIQIFSIINNQAIISLRYIR